jgi:hypothetical protein
VAGLNRVTLGVPRSSARHTLRVTASDGAGRVAAHRLSFVADRVLTRRTARKTLSMIESGTSDVEYWLIHRPCRRTTRTAFRCRRYEYDAGDTRRLGTATVRLDRDGLVRYVVRNRRGRVTYTSASEPGA